MVPALTAEQFADGANAAPNFMPVNPEAAAAASKPKVGLWTLIFGLWTLISTLTFQLHVDYLIIYHFLTVRCNGIIVIY